MFAQEPGHHEVCPICLWEDDLAQLEASREGLNDRGENAATMSYRIRTLDDEWMWVRTTGRVIAPTNRYPGICLMIRFCEVRACLRQSLVVVFGLLLMLSSQAFAGGEFERRLFDPRLDGKWIGNGISYGAYRDGEGSQQEQLLYRRELEQIAHVEAGERFLQDHQS